LFGRRRYERAVAAARRKLDSDLAAYDVAQQAVLDELLRDFQVRAAEVQIVLRPTMYLHPGSDGTISPSGRSISRTSSRGSET
jgi:hypothetical protein